jgi:hypothetical protein
MLHFTIPWHTEVGLELVLKLAADSKVLRGWSVALVNVGQTTAVYANSVYGRALHSFPISTTQLLN